MSEERPEIDVNVDSCRSIGNEVAIRCGALQAAAMIVASKENSLSTLKEMAAATQVLAIQFEAHLRGAAS